jgi:hypothetical protein
MRRLLVPLLLVSWLAADAREPLLVGGDFSAWKDGLPEGWSLEVGARSGKGPPSRVERGEEGGVRLGGDADTGTWRYLFQRPAEADVGACRLRFEACLVGGRLDPGQFDSAYAGLRALRGGSQVLSVGTVNHATWEPGEAVLGPGVADLEVRLFLAKSGALDVRNVRLEGLPPEASFDVLVDHMARYYSFFDVKGIDWRTHAATFRGRAMASSDPGRFVDHLQELLRPLKDMHVWMVTPEGTRVGTWSEVPPANSDLRAVVRGLRSVRQIAKVALTGRAGTEEEGIGYLAVGSFQLDDATYAQVEAALEEHLESRGLLLDLRSNDGGNETWGQRLASLLADEPRVYARRRVRAGDAPSEFGAPFEAWIRPREGKRFSGPIVALVGPRCASSGEGFVQMLAALPHVTLVGLPTRGASGSPGPVALPNGVTVWFSRWQSLLPDGSLLEGRGVPPDVVVNHAGEGDPTFAAGLALLREKLAR